MIDRILIIGFGSIGRRHLRVARKLLPDADIRILRHKKDASIPEHSNGIFSSLAQALDFVPKLAVIASPAPFHLEQALAMAKNGVHLLVEKPISSTCTGVQQLLNICRDNKSILLTGYNLRFTPSLRQFRTMLKNNQIGKVLSVRCEVGQYLPSWRPDTDYKTGVTARSELGGGVLLELSHEIDYLRWIFGEVEWIQGVLGRQSDLEIDVEDSAYLVIGFSGGMGDNQLIATLNMDFIRQDKTRYCTAIGKTSSLRWNGVTDIVEMWDGNKESWQKVFYKPQDRDDSYLAEWKHLIECISECRDPLVSGKDGLAVLHIIEAAREASVTGGQVQIRDYR